MKKENSHSLLPSYLKITIAHLLLIVLTLFLSASFITTKANNGEFKVESISLSAKGILTWITNNEHLRKEYTIQHFKWNKWIDIGTVTGEGEHGINEYTFDVFLHSGENKVRIVIKQQKGKNTTLASINFISQRQEVTYYYNKKSKRIEFDEKTCFEVFDIYGNVIKKGNGTYVNVAELPKSKVYYFCYDNSIAKIKK